MHFFGGIQSNLSGATQILGNTVRYVPSGPATIGVALAAIAVVGVGYLVSRNPEVLDTHTWQDGFATFANRCSELWKLHTTLNSEERKEYYENVYPLLENFNREKRSELFNNYMNLDSNCKKNTNKNCLLVKNHVKDESFDKVEFLSFLINDCSNYIIEIKVPLSDEELVEIIKVIMEEGSERRLQLLESFKSFCSFLQEESISLDVLRELAKMKDFPARGEFCLPYIVLNIAWKVEKKEEEEGESSEVVELFESLNAIYDSEEKKKNLKRLSEEVLKKENVVERAFCLEAIASCPESIVLDDKFEASVLMNIMQALHNVEKDNKVDVASKINDLLEKFGVDLHGKIAYELSTLNEDQIDDFIDALLEFEDYSMANVDLFIAVTPDSRKEFAKTIKPLFDAIPHDLQAKKMHLLTKLKDLWIDSKTHKPDPKKGEGSIQSLRIFQNEMTSQFKNGGNFTCKLIDTWVDAISVIPAGMAEQAWDDAQRLLGQRLKHSVYHCVLVMSILNRYQLDDKPEFIEHAAKLLEKDAKVSLSEDKYFPEESVLSGMALLANTYGSNCLSDLSGFISLSMNLAQVITFINQENKDGHTLLTWGNIQEKLRQS